LAPATRNFYFRLLALVPLPLQTTVFFSVALALILCPEIAGYRPRARRRFCTHVANVGYLTPTSFANSCPLNPLRSNSSSNCSRRAAGVLIRPSTSHFNIAPSVGGVFVIAHTLRHL